MKEPTIEEQIRINKNQIAYFSDVVDKLFDDYNGKNNEAINIFLEEIAFNMSCLVRVLQKHQRG
jgi:hypothetical protein